jgi:hypothetical protein
MTCRSRPSWATHAYYRASIVPALREECGYISDAECHRHIKAGFFEMDPRDPNLPSMAAMSQDEANRLIEFAWIQAGELGIRLEEPRKRA